MAAVRSRRSGRPPARDSRDPLQRQPGSAEPSRCSSSIFHTTRCRESFTASFGRSFLPIRGRPANATLRSPPRTQTHPSTRRRHHDPGRGRGARLGAPLRPAIAGGLRKASASPTALDAPFRGRSSEDWFSVGLLRQPAARCEGISVSGRRRIAPLLMATMPRPAAELQDLGDLSDRQESVRRGLRRPPGRPRCRRRRPSASRALGWLPLSRLRARPHPSLQRREARAPTGRPTPRGRIPRRVRCPAL